MQLHIARLCLDCDEVHGEETCPVCGSEAFAFLSRWVPAPERRRRPRPTTSPEADVYRQLIAAPPAEAPEERQPTLRFRKRVMSVAALAVAGWIWSRRPPRSEEEADERDARDHLATDRRQTGTE